MTLVLSVSFPHFIASICSLVGIFARWRIGIDLVKLSSGYTLVYFVRKLMLERMLISSERAREWERNGEFRLSGCKCNDCNGFFTSPLFCTRLSLSIFIYSMSCPVTRFIQSLSLSFFLSCSLPFFADFSHWFYIFVCKYIENLRAFRLLMSVCLLLFFLCVSSFCFYYVVACKCHFFSRSFQHFLFLHTISAVGWFSFRALFSISFRFVSNLPHFCVLNEKQKTKYWISVCVFLYLLFSLVVWFHSFLFKIYIYQFRFTNVSMCSHNKMRMVTQK